MRIKAKFITVVSDSLIQGEERLHQDSKKNQDLYVTEEERETHAMQVILKKVKKQERTWIGEISLAKAVNQQWGRLGLACERSGISNLDTILSMGLRAIENF